MKVQLNGLNLSVKDVVDVSRNNYVVELPEESVGKINRSRNYVETMISEGESVYGLTTGFGSLSNVSIPLEDVEKLQENLIKSHAVGVGEPLSEDIVRAVMLIRINTFVKGFSGIRLSTVQLLVDMLNRGVHPIIPEKGSVGASGDLAPLSHMVLVMIGRGEAMFNGQRMSGKEALLYAGLSPIKLSFKEGLALNNGTTVMTAIMALNIHDSENLIKNTLIASSLSLESLKGCSVALNENIHLARPHFGQGRCASIISKLIEGSKLIDSTTKVQDAYSLRALPQIIGASLDSVKYIKGVVETEINSATDNPLIFEGKAISGANFHGQPIALVADFLGIAISELGNLSERIIFRMLDPNLNEGLPAFLVKESGLNSGLMIPQYVAAALVSENKGLAHPSSVDSIPTCANQEDHVSMGTIGARKARDIIHNVEEIISILYMCSVQALELRNIEEGSMIAQLVHNKIREVSPYIDNDREFRIDLAKINSLIRNNEILDIIERGVKLDI